MNSVRETSVVGRLQRVPLPEVWPHEAYDFTTWLQQNIDILTAETGLELLNVEREQSTQAISMLILSPKMPVVRRSSLKTSWARATTIIWAR